MVARRFRQGARLANRTAWRLWTAVRHRTGRIHAAPVFVLGNQKSGTTAIAALLAELTGQAATLDIFFRCRGPVLARLLTKSWTFDEFVQRYKAFFATPIIKEPSLTFLYDELRKRFPRSRVVWVMRDPRDNIRSILDRLGLPGHLDHLEPGCLDGFPPDRGWRLILDGTLFGCAGRSYIETLARRWSLAAELAVANRADIHLIRYEDFTADKEGSLKRLARDLNLEPVRDIAARVDVQFQPRGRRDVDWREFFGPENLALIHRVCSAHMAEFGYSRAIDGPSSQ